MCCTVFKRPVVCLYQWFQLLFGDVWQEQMGPQLGSLSTFHIVKDEQMLISPVWFWNSFSLLLEYKALKAVTQNSIVNGEIIVDYIKAD